MPGHPGETVRTRFFRALRLQLEQRLMASVTELYAFHLSRCERVVEAVLSRLRALQP